MMIRYTGAVILGATVLLSAVTAQAGKPEQDPQKAQPKAKKAVPMRAVRLTAAGVQRTPPTQEELKERFEKKIEGAWLNKANWVTDLDKAREDAKASGKQIFAYFTRSYAP